MERIYKALKLIRKYKLYPETPIVSSPHKPELIVNGKKVLLFASNNYLGMLTDERVIKAAIDGAKKWGIGNGSARLLTGNLDIHLKLEEAIAKFKHKEAAITFVAGYMVNSGCIPAIVNVVDLSLLSIIKKKKSKPDTIVFSDQYNHASIVTGIKLSGAEKEIYNHNDMVDLENRLKKYPKKQRKLIVSDGVFSMDGDIVNLPKLVELAKKYNAMTYIDDAHATGILGKHGRGTEDYFDMENSVDFVMGTFTKCFGGVGGYITSNQEAIDYLKVTAKDFIFTAPIAPPVACGLIKSVEIVGKETWRREKLLENAEYMKIGLKNLGFDIMNSQSQIIPVFIGNENKALKVCKMLLDDGIFVPVARWPAVPAGMARLRMTVMADHTHKQIDYLLSVMKKIKAKEKL